MYGVRNDNDKYLTCQTEIEVSFKECTEKRKDKKKTFSVNPDDRTVIDDNIDQILSHYINVHGGTVKITSYTDLILYLK